MDGLIQEHQVQPGSENVDNNLPRDTQSDYDEVDYKICGELGTLLML